MRARPIPTPFLLAAMLAACGGEPGKPGVEVAPCVSSCAGKVCGDDGCGGTCGVCPAAASICVSGACVASCTPGCAGRVCGDDGCGGTCGACPAASICVAGACVASCTPSCAGRVCGDDGCGGTCGGCPAASICVAGACVASCTPSCAGKVCGDDGCGGSCGTCPPGAACAQGACEAPGGSPGCPEGGTCNYLQRTAWRYDCTSADQCQRAGAIGTYGSYEACQTCGCMGGNSRCGDQFGNPSDPERWSCEQCRVSCHEDGVLAACGVEHETAQGCLLPDPICSTYLADCICQ